MTLIEVIVACSVLGIIGTAAMVAFSIGLLAFGPGGTTDRTTASNDLMVFEQRLGEDVARAACIEAPPQSNQTFGSCTHSLASGSTPCVSSGSSLSLLCLSWAEPASAGSTTFVCHTAVYSPAGGVITRSETYSGGSSQTHVSLDPVTVGSVILSVTTYPTWTPTPGSSWPTMPPWIAQVRVNGVKSANSKLQNTPTANFQLQPISVDPGSITMAAVC